MLWTRISGAGWTAVTVEWTVAADPDLHSVVSSGSARASPEGDHTVHVEVGGLEPGTVYWYGFSAGPARSPVGRTRTAPSGPVARLRIGVVCCSHWTAGYFNAYGRLADRDVDLILHLGDYLYEDDSHRTRRYRVHDPPGRVSTLAGYRARYAQYRTDPDLQRLHHRHPVVAVWDDHELAGNAWWDGAARHVRWIDGDWVARREAATRAYLEWLPVRRPDPADPLRLWRRIDLGGLCHLIVLDTRLVGREQPAAGRRPVVGVWRRRRSLLGDAQRRWLEDELTGGGPAWRLLASQVVVAPVHFAQVPARLQSLGRLLGMVGGGLVVNPGQWDGYPDERDRLYRLLAARPGDTVVVSGDLHSSWASELTAAGDEPVAVEMVAPSVSAPSFAVAVGKKFPGGHKALERVIRKQNPHVGFVETAGHGYLLLEITPERVEGRWWHVDTVRRRQPGEHLAGVWSVKRGRPRLVPGPEGPGG